MNRLQPASNYGSFEPRQRSAAVCKAAAAARSNFGRLPNLSCATLFGAAAAGPADTAALRESRLPRPASPISRHNENCCDSRRLLHSEVLECAGQVVSILSVLAFA